MPPPPGYELGSCLSPCPPWADEEITHPPWDPDVFKGLSTLSSAGRCPLAAGCQAGRGGMPPRHCQE